MRPAATSIQNMLNYTYYNQLTYNRYKRMMKSLDQCNKTTHIQIVKRCTLCCVQFIHCSEPEKPYRSLIPYS